MGQLTDRVIKLGVFHRKGLSTFTRRRRGTYYDAGILVLAYTSGGQQVLVAKVEGLNNTEITKKLQVVRQLFSEIVGKDISFKLRSGGGNIMFEIDSGSLPQRLQKLCSSDCCYQYKGLKLLQ